MRILFSLFKEIYEHRALAFSRRFLPLTLLLAFGFVIMMFNSHWWLSGKFVPSLLFFTWSLLLMIVFCWGIILLPFEASRLKRVQHQIAQLDYKGAQRSLNKTYLFSTPVYKIRRCFLQNYLFMQTGLMLEANELLKELSTKPLIMSERNLLVIAKTRLFLEVGNRRDAVSTFDKIDSSNILETEGQVRYAFLASGLAELDSDFKSAKAKLEQVLEDAEIDKVNKARVYHNLARLEDVQGNVNTALGYYDHAWCLLKLTEHFLQTSITAYNMILLYARSGDILKTYKKLSEYELLVDVDNPSQLLEFNNCTVALARQIGDRKLLLQAYRSSAVNIAPKITKDERLTLFVSNLRMCMNDCVDFEAHLVKTMRHLLDATDLQLLHELAAYKEVLGVLRQVLAISLRPDLLVYHGWISLQYIQRETLLDAERAEIPVCLPSYREKWFMFKLELIKVKFNLNALGVPKREMESLFATLTELKNIWSDKDNPLAEMKSLMLLLDEYVAFLKQLNNIQFKQDFAILARTTLGQAENLLQVIWQQPPMHQYTVGLAWFWFKIGNDKSKAELWLERFNSKKLNMSHFARWYQEQYVETKEWLSKV